MGSYLYVTSLTVRHLKHVYISLWRHTWQLQCNTNIMTICILIFINSCRQSQRPLQLSDLSSKGLPWTWAVFHRPSVSTYQKGFTCPIKFPPKCSGFTATAANTVWWLCQSVSKWTKGNLCTCMETSSVNTWFSCSALLLLGRDYKAWA